jgi:hypothetical protein
MCAWVSVIKQRSMIWNVDGILKIKIPFVVRGLEIT